MTGKLNLIQVPKDTQGPLYAEEQTYGTNNNTQLITIHNHDGVNGGALIDIAGQQIGSDLNLDGYNVVGARSFRGQSNASTLSGINDLNQLYNTQGDWYANDGAGNIIRLTENGELAVASFPQLLKLNVKAIANVNYTIDATENTTAFDITTSTANSTITLPIATAVGSGRQYYFFDAGNNASAHPITIQVAVGSGNQIVFQHNTGSTSLTFPANGMSCFMYTDGAANWYASFYGQNTYMGQTISFNNSSVLSLSNSILLLDATSSIAATTGSALGGDLTLSGTIEVKSGGTIAVETGGLITSGITGGILSASTGGIKTGVINGFQLGGGSSDWPAFSVARTRTLTFPMIGFLGSGWTTIGGSLGGPGVSSTTVIPIPVVHNGATLTSVVVWIQLAGAPRTAPVLSGGANPNIAVQVVNCNAGQSTLGTLYLSSTNVQSLPNAAYAGNTTMQALTYTCNQNNVIDNGNHMYYLSLNDETGTGAISGNIYVAMQLNYTGIANMAFPT